jgi:crotonobetaine/carnitine-CoA ligase
MYSAIADPARWILPEVLAEMAATRPDAPWMSDSGGDAMSFGQADADTCRAAGFFNQLGIERGHRVAVFMLNSCNQIRAWLGLGKLGAVAVMLNTELRGAFLRHQLNDAEVGCVVVDAELVPALTAIAGELAHLRQLVVVGRSDERLPLAWRAYDWAGIRAAEPWTGPGPSAADTACIMYTSGTSGPSKGVLMPHAHCALYGIINIRALELGPQDKYYISLPLFHANGLLIQLAATLLAGIPVHVRTRFSATAWLADVREHGATVSNFLGATAAFLLAQPPSPHDTDHRLRALMNAPNLPQHEEQFRQRFGIRDVISGFGMTEVNMPIMGRIGHSAPGAAGWTMEDFFEVCIADPDTDRALPAGTMGEILVRPKVPFGFMSGYFNAPQKTVEAWRNLWFHTGDAGVMDADGLITFIDRIKDCIRRRGENISATEVESVVQEIAGVAEVAAYAVPSDIPGGEDELMLALVPHHGIALDARMVVDQAAVRLPRFARPRYVKVVAQLPKTATGKVQRAALRKQGAEGAIDLSASS